MAVDKNMVGTHTDKDSYINTVLTIYTENLYHLQTLTGIRGGIEFVAGDWIHEIYGAIMVLIGLLALWTMRYMYLRSKLTDFLKQVGLSFLIAAVISFVFLIVVFSVFVNPWIATNEDIYKQGLPIIASMIEEFYMYYIVGIGVVGVILMLPSIPAMLSKGKKEPVQVPAK